MRKLISIEQGLLYKPLLNPNKEQKVERLLYNDGVRWKYADSDHELDENNDEAKIMEEQYQKINPEIRFNITHVPYQLCPKCNGQKTVSIPHHIAGDVQQFSSSDISFTCGICKGEGIIPYHTIEELK